MDLNESFITESPNITSIIAAFEAYENPINLFFKQQSCKYIEDKIDSIDGNLDVMKDWITTYPNMQVNRTDLNQTVAKFKGIKKKMLNLYNTYKRIANECEEITRKKPFNATCGFCETKFTLNTSADLIEMEHHDDIAAILSLGQSLQPLQNDSNSEEDDDVNEKNITRNEVDDNNKIKLLVNYSPEILKKLYPKHIMQRVCKQENQNKYFTIQSISASAPRFQCLLCKVEISSYKSIDSHIYGQQHASKFKKPNMFESVVEYHEHFMALPPKFQVLQLLFKPAPQLSYLYCAVCLKPIRTKDIWKHVTEDSIHIYRFQARSFKRYHFFEKLVHITSDKIEELSEESDDCSSTSTKSSSKSIVSENENASLPSTTTTMNGTSTKISPSTMKHTIIPSYNEIPIELKDFIAKRLQRHLNFINFDDDVESKTCICMFCKKTLMNNHQELVTHFISEEHTIKSRAEFGKIKYNYYCGLCYKYFKTELKWSYHLLSNDHKLREYTIPNKILKDSNFKEYECINCSLVIYGNKGSIDAHKNGKYGIPNRRKQIKEVKLSSQLELILKNENLFTSEIYKMSKDSMDVLNSIDLALKCCTAIEQALTPVFGVQVQAYPFGSRVSGLGSTASDLDVFVDVGLMYDGLCNQSNEKQTYFVQQASRALRKHRDFEDICAIPAARTPIVQVYHKATDLDCDLSFRHGLSVENTEFLRLCIDIQPKLKTLILFLKKWITLNNLKDKISTYAVSMMAIYFMQNRNYLPSLKDLKRIDPRKSKMIAGWETFCFRKPLSELRELYPLYSLFTRDLLGEFLQFYITFDFQTQVICPLLGQSIPKTDFAEAKGSRLPNEMINYVNKINENKDNEVFKITKSICIQDPFDLSHNLTKACTVNVLAKIITLSKQSYQLLCNSQR